jgi:phosphatidylserine/phosphatidylglycerophosphate/cardiolipin synthase-like enzyme
MVIDSATILTGSFNFTKAAEAKNAESLLVIKDAPELIKAYEANIHAPAGHSQPIWETGVCLACWDGDGHVCRREWAGPRE